MAIARLDECLPRCTVEISSHILGELEKIATHSGITHGGRMIEEMSAAELEADFHSCVSIRADCRS